MKQKCFNKKLLSLYYYKELDDENMNNSIREHLKECRNCRAYYNAMTRLSFAMNNPAENIDKSSEEIVETKIYSSHKMKKILFPITSTAVAFFFLFLTIDVEKPVYNEKLSEKSINRICDVFADSVYLEQDIIDEVIYNSTL